MFSYFIALYTRKSFVLLRDKEEHSSPILQAKDWTIDALGNDYWRVTFSIVEVTGEVARLKSLRSSMTYGDISNRIGQQEFENLVVAENAPYTATITLNPVLSRAKKRIALEVVVSFSNRSRMHKKPATFKASIIPKDSNAANPWESGLEIRSQEHMDQERVESVARLSRGPWAVYVDKDPPAPGE